MKTKNESLRLDFGDGSNNNQIFGTMVVETYEPTMENAAKVVSGILIAADIDKVAVKIMYAAHDVADHDWLSGELVVNKDGTFEVVETLN